MYYLIESPESPLWLRLRCSTNGDSRSAEILWTDDAHEALRFSRQVDATSFCHLHPKIAFLARITEHVDISPAKPAEAV